MVLQEDSELSDSPNMEVDIPKSISYKEAHSAIQTMLMFLEQNRNDNIKVSRDDLLLYDDYCVIEKQNQLNWFAASIKITSLSHNAKLILFMYYRSAIYLRRSHNPTRRTVHNISLYGGEAEGIMLCDMAGKFPLIIPQLCVDFRDTVGVNTSRLHRSITMSSLFTMSRCYFQ